MINKIIKGDPDYLKNKRLKTIIITIIYFAVSLGIIAVGYLTTGTKRNLLTVIGILGCLPSCKSAVSMIMLCLAKGCSKELKDRLFEINGRLVLMYDMYFTSLNTNYSISNMIVDNGIIIAITEDTKMNHDSFKEHINTMLKQGGNPVNSITVTSSADKYIEMINKLNSTSSDGDTSKDDAIRIALYEISL